MSTKNLFIPLSIVIGSGLIAAAVYFGLQTKQVDRKTATQPNNQPTAASTAPTLSPSPNLASPTPPPRQPEITWTKDDILTALNQATTIDKDKIDYSISDQLKQDDRVLIHGAVIEMGAMDGAGFMGYIDRSGVHITYVGQGVPECSEVDPYNYPVSWADYCLTPSGETKRR